MSKTPLNKEFSKTLNLAWYYKEYISDSVKSEVYRNYLQIKATKQIRWNYSSKDK